jgi:hypothetical protein
MDLLAVQGATANKTTHRAVPLRAAVTGGHTTL